MLSLRFLGSKYLINLRRQFRIRKPFRAQGFAGFTVFYFVFKTTVSKMLINRLLTCTFVLVNGIVFTKPAFTCSKLTIETLEQGVKYVQS